MSGEEEVFDLAAAVAADDALVLDGDNRIGGFKGSVDYQGPSGWSAALTSPSEEMKASFLADCEAAFTARAMSRSDDYSSGTTYFLKMSETPRCALEALAAAVFNAHTADKVSDWNPERSGAEWWTVCMNNEDEVGFHWDRDYSIELEDGLNIHPHLSTVTYLTGQGGAPTVILPDLVSPLQCTEENGFGGGRIASAYGFFPSPGQHVAFDGRLLHAAPTELAPLSGNSQPKARRVTFLVNVWVNHIPKSVERFPEERLSGLKLTAAAVSEAVASDASRAAKRQKTDTGTAPVDATGWPEFALNTVLPAVNRFVGAGDGAQRLEWEFVESGRRMSVRLDVPASEPSAGFHWVYPGDQDVSAAPCVVAGDEVDSDGEDEGDEGDDSDSEDEAPMELEEDTGDL